jgi:hypothetical protein
MITHTYLWGFERIRKISHGALLAKRPMLLFLESIQVNKQEVIVLFAAFQNSQIALIHRVLFTDSDYGL